MTFRKALVMMLVGVSVALAGCAQKGMKADTPQAGEKAVAQAAEKAKATAIQQIREMMASGEAYTNEQIMPLYDLLDPVTVDEALGTWKGGKFDGGKMPDPINWYGKRFNSANDAEPLLARKPDGTVYSFDKWGMARLREVKFRGKVSMSLIYDAKPIMDYFRKLDDDTLIGLGDFKGKLMFFFYLERVKEAG